MSDSVSNKITFVKVNHKNKIADQKFKSQIREMFASNKITSMKGNY